MMNIRIRNKREQLHSRIRNASKEAFFQTVRKQLVYQNNSQKIQIESQAINNSLFQNLQSFENISQTLSEIYQKLNKCNQFESRNFILQLIDRGGFIVLIKILQLGFKRQNYTKQQQEDKFQIAQKCLNLICKIISLEKINIGKNLANKGLIQLVIQYLSDSRLFVVCCHIIGNIAIEDQFFAERILATKAFQQIIKHIIEITNSFSNQELYQLRKIQNISFIKYYLDCQNQILKKLRVGLWSLANLVCIQNLVQYPQQVLEILDFSINYMLSKRVLLQNTLQLIYEIGFTFQNELMKRIIYVTQQNIKQSSNHKSFLSQNLNQIMIEIIKKQNKCEKQIVYLMNLISKILYEDKRNKKLQITSVQNQSLLITSNNTGIDFILFLKIVIIPSNLMTLKLNIFQRLSYFLFIKTIIHDIFNRDFFQIWWEELVDKLQNYEQKKKILKICQNLQIEGQWVFRFISDLLNDDSCNDQKIKALTYLYDLINKVKQNQQDSKKFLFLIKKHQIKKHLKKILEKENVNQNIYEKSQHILEGINYLDVINQQKKKIK